MIPKIIHQTWKTEVIPLSCRAFVESWKTLNPDWQYILWTDVDLDAFVAQNYPDFLAIFRAYELGVQRADAARYLLLHHFGGFYTDIDTECFKPLDIFALENRIIFCDEPAGHSKNYLTSRKLDRLLFNGTIASPAGNPFWLTLLANLEKNRFTHMVLDSTGPIILSATVQNYPDKQTFSFNSAHLFCGKDVLGKSISDERLGEYGNADISLHHWVGTWYNKPTGRKKIKILPLRTIKRVLRSHIYNLTKGKQYESKIDPNYLTESLGAPTHQETIAVFIPVRDAEANIEKCMELLGDLDWPKSQIHVTFCEGDSTDGTVEALNRIAAENKFKFASINIIHKHVRTNFKHKHRSQPKLQRQRRAGIAAVRNYLIDTALTPETDWVLWIDSDVNAYPPSALKQLLAEQKKIVVPHCVRDDGSNRTFDLNSFITVYETRDSFHYRHIIGGIFQPPSSTDRRIHLGDLRYFDRIELDAVGGTMLLVQANVHRAGIRFPDLPYKELIETEAFGQLAKDHGITPIGLPNLTITHPV